jgi:hypothetical protein
VARKFPSGIDLVASSLLNALLNPVSSDPTGLGTGQAGEVWFNTVSGKLMYWNGTAAIDATNRANHTGTQLSSTISDLASVVMAYRLDQFAAPTNPVSLNSQRITNLSDPTSVQDAATKNYVDNSISGVAGGLILKGAVVCAPTTNVSLTSPGATLDGVTMSAGMIVLLTGQTTASQNGPYVWNGASSTMTRATNWATTAEAVLGSFWVVEQGTNADTLALCTNDTAITLGTTSLTFTFRGAAGATYTAGNGLSLAGSSFSVNPASGGGIAVAAGGVSVDGTVARKVTGLVPATTTGIFSVSGSAVTINHALGNVAPLLVVRVGATPPAGYSTGQLVEMDNVASDLNNIVLTLPAAPATGNWVITVVG